MDHTILCKNCHTKIARTPNKICVKCQAQNWGYTQNELNEDDSKEKSSDPTISSTKNDYTILCNVCHTVVAKTPNKLCVKCGAKNWGYTDNEVPVNKVEPSSTLSFPKPNDLKKNKTVLSILIGVAILIGGIIFYNKYFKEYSEEGLIDLYSKNVTFVYHQYVYRVYLNGDQSDSLDFIKTAEDSFLFYQPEAPMLMMPNEIYSTGVLLSQNGKILVSSKTMNPWSEKEIEELRKEIGSILIGATNIRIEGKTIFLGIGMPGKSIKNETDLTAYVYSGELPGQGVSTIQPANNSFDEKDIREIQIPSKFEMDASAGNYLFYYDCTPFIGEKENELHFHVVNTNENRGNVTCGNIVFDKKGDLVGVE